MRYMKPITFIDHIFRFIIDCPTPFNKLRSW